MLRWRRFGYHFSFAVLIFIHLRQNPIPNSNDYQCLFSVIIMTRIAVKVERVGQLKFEIWGLRSDGCDVPKVEESSSFQHQSRDVGLTGPK